MPETDFPAAETQGWHRTDAAGFMPAGMPAILRVRG
jgi:hypothetical protein